MEIRVLARHGMGLREIARQTGLSRNTVRRYLRQPWLERYGPRAARPMKLDAFKIYVQERIEAARPRWIPATVLLRELRERGYEGGISQLKAFVAPLKPTNVEPVVRFETAPGVQMQADFTVVRRGREALLAFVATLGFSRATFVRFTAAEDAATLCGCLRQAFEFFGGVPQHVLFDTPRRWSSNAMPTARACGLTPRRDQSGETDNPGRISKAGDRDVRMALYTGPPMP